MGAEQRDRIGRIMADVAEEDVRAALRADGHGQPDRASTDEMRARVRGIAAKMPAGDVAKLAAMTDAELRRHFQEIGRRGLAQVRPS